MYTSVFFLSCCIQVLISQCANKVVKWSIRPGVYPDDVFTTTVEIVAEVFLVIVHELHFSMMWTVKAGISI